MNKLRLLKTSLDNRLITQAEQNLLQKLIETSREFKDLKAFRAYLIELREESQKDYVFRMLTKDEEVREALDRG
jgi:hypothetical protein